MDNLTKTVDNLIRMWISHKKFIYINKREPLYIGVPFCTLTNMDFFVFCGNPVEKYWLKTNSISTDTRGEKKRESTLYTEANKKKDCIRCKKQKKFVLSTYPQALLQLRLIKQLKLIE